MKFEVIRGKHCEPIVQGKGRKGKANKNYSTGDIVESDKPLDKIFKNKFKRVGKFVTEEDQPEVSVAKPYKVFKDKENEGCFNVKQQGSDPVNDKPIDSKKEAKALAKKMNI